MESTKKIKDQADAGSQATTPNKQDNKTEPTVTQRGSAQSTQASKEHEGSNFGNEANQVIDQAKQVATDVYNRTSKSLNEGYTQAVEYGRENPGTTLLIAFGAGIGVGLLLAGGFTSRGSRTSRILPPVMNALTEIATEVFR